MHGRRRSCSDQPYYAYGESSHIPMAVAHSNSQSRAAPCALPEAAAVDGTVETLFIALYITNSVALVESWQAWMGGVDACHLLFSSAPSTFRRPLGRVVRVTQGSFTAPTP